jgi:adenine-specific DNA methylase
MAAPKKAAPEKKPVELVPVSTDLAIASNVKPVAVEERQKAVVKRDIESLNKLTTELEEKRQFSTVESRLKDLQYVEKIEEFLDIVMDAMTCDPALLKKGIQDMIAAGKMDKLQSLLTSLGIAMDKRSMALQVFDDARENAGSKKKIKLNLMWKQGEDGTQGIQAEVTGG